MNDLSEQMYNLATANLTSLQSTPVPGDELAAAKRTARILLAAQNKANLRIIADGGIGVTVDPAIAKANEEVRRISLVRAEVAYAQSLVDAALAATTTDAFAEAAQGFWQAPLNVRGRSEDDAFIAEYCPAFE